MNKKINPSWRHHYIPEFYQKGFIDKEFYVFDKKKWKLKKNKFSSRSIFFEPHRNSIKVNDETSDILETKMFSFIDDRFSRILDEIRNSNGETIYNTGSLEEFFIFINFMKLRNPAYDHVVYKLFENYDMSDLGFDIIDLNEGKPISGNKRANISNDDMMIKSLPMIVMALPFMKNEKLMDLVQKNHHLYYHSKTSNLGILGDNPVIIYNDPKDVYSFPEYIFPVSENILSTYLIDIKNPIISKQFMIEKDVCLLHQAEKYIGCKSKEYLLAIVKMYEKVCEMNYQDKLITNLFSHFVFNKK